MSAFNTLPPSSVSSPATDSAVPAVNAAATVAFAAVPGQRHVIEGMSWSFSAAPAAGTTLIVQDGATTVRTWYISAGGPGWLPLKLSSTPGNALTITLAAGGSGISGTMNAEGHRTE